MKKYILCFLISLTASVVNAADSQTLCRGSSFTEDGLVYENIYFLIGFNSDQGNFDLSADGHNDNHEYDIKNRFSDVPFVGSVTKNSSGRVVSAKMSGNHLPDGRRIEAVIDISRAKTKSKITIERTNGLLIKSLLSCETTLQPICRTENKCHPHCHPMVGCEDICQTHTICVPQKFD